MLIIKHEGIQYYLNKKRLIFTNTIFLQKIDIKQKRMVFVKYEYKTHLQSIWADKKWKLS